MCARSVEDLHQAFARWTDRVNNYAVADIHGCFGYMHAGRIPVREAANGWCAIPGWTGEHEWQGYIPHAELPKAIDPAAGYAITCNQRVTGSDYPYYVGLVFSPDYRARRIQTRILELAKGTATPTPEAMGRIYAECVSLPAKVFTRTLLAIEPPNTDCAQALDLLRQWDSRMDRDQVQPAVPRRQLCPRRLCGHGSFGQPSMFLIPPTGPARAGSRRWGPLATRLARIAPTKPGFGPMWSLYLSCGIGRRLATGRRRRSF